jgi:aryl-alcohol dehydrogenase-like predicted oxidoreductase
VIFGAAALARVSQETADEVLPLLLRHGINHIDTAASYGDSELRVGPWMAAHRDRFFLATKTGERGYAGARDSIRRSLERLGVAQLDLIQLHNLVDPAEWETAFSPDGALRAAVEAREQGLVRFIGVTGHGTTVAAMHQRSLARFPFDSVLFPLNYPMLQNPRYAADVRALLALCAERGVAVQTIKGITRGPWGEKPRTHASWYEPLERQADIDRAVAWVLAHPGVFLNSTSDIGLRARTLDAADRLESLRAPSDAEMAELVAAREMTPLFV